MTSVLWATCPGCRGRFHYDDTGDLRHKKSKLRCPYCDREFNQAEERQESDQ